MLEKILTIVRIAAYSAVTFVAIAAGILCLNGRSVLTGLRNDEDEAHRVLLEAALTAKEARQASAEERQFLNKTLPQLSTQMSVVLKNTSVAVAGVNKDTRALNTLLVQIGDNTTLLSSDAHNSLATLQDTLLDLQPVEEKLNNTVRDTDLLISSPEVKDTLSNVDNTTQSLAKTLDHTDKTTADIQQSVHSLLHPKWFTRVVNYGVDVARIVPFLF